jgi:hypothetical protein
VILDAGAGIMTGEWAWGCIVLAVYQAWSWLFRARIDPWARRLVGSHLGVEVIWLPASRFPVELWTWGLGGRGGRRFDGRFALGATALCFAGALLPIAVLCALLHWTTWMSTRFGHALYLVTPPLVAVFVAYQMGRTRLEDREN